MFINQITIEFFFHSNHFKNFFLSHLNILKINSFSLYIYIYIYLLFLLEIFSGSCSRAVCPKNIFPNMYHTSDVDLAIRLLPQLRSCKKLQPFVFVDFLQSISMRQPWSHLVFCPIQFSLSVASRVRNTLCRRGTPCRKPLPKTEVSVSLSLWGCVTNVVRALWS